MKNIDAAKLLTFVFVGLLTGCVSPLPTREYIVEMTIVVNDKLDSNYYNPGNCTAYVRYGIGKDKNGEPLPDFYALGHEVWHHIKGHFHK